MPAQSATRLDELAEELTRRLGIPFQSNGREIEFRERLRITDWAVPLMFDGHATRHEDAVVPVNFVGHALWPALRPVRHGRGDRAWWYCNLSPEAGKAIVKVLEEQDEYAMDEGWVVGHDVLLDDVFGAEPTPARRRVA